MGRIARRMRAAMLAAEQATEQQAAKQQEPAPGSQDDRRGARTGRPRLSTREGFVEDFCRLLPALSGGEISKAEAARTLGISHRSLTRYLAEAACQRSALDSLSR